MVVLKKEKTETKTKKEPAGGVILKSKPELGEGFAIIETGGKQYKVSSGDVLLVEKMSDEHKAGDAIAFDKVLLLWDGKELTLGNPYISGAVVQALFEEHKRGKKINVLRFKSKSRYIKRGGHRQTYAKVKIL